MSHQIKKPLIILGMHRSGTSCLAGTLQQAGLCLGEVSTNNKFNKKGNRENSLVMNLNNDLLKFNNASWDKPSEGKKWNESHCYRAKELAILLEKNCKKQYWGFKDPRILLNYPFWNSLFPEAILIGTIRNPIDVAHSLHRRDENFSIEEGLNLWNSYNKNLLLILKKKPFPLISFDYPNELYKKKIEIILSTLFSKEHLREVNFFDNTLRTKSKNRLKLSSEVNLCYEELQTFLS